LDSVPLSSYSITHSFLCCANSSFTCSSVYSFMNLFFRCVLVMVASGLLHLQDKQSNSHLTIHLANRILKSLCSHKQLQGIDLPPPVAYQIPLSTCFQCFPFVLYQFRN